MNDSFDCIIVGGGIAGLSAAMTLARHDVRFLLVERGAACGAKNVSGGVLWGTDLARLVPRYWDDDAAFERYVDHRRLTFLDTDAATSVDFRSDHFGAPPYAGITVLRARFDAWLARQVMRVVEDSPRAGESFIATDVLVSSLEREEGRVVGIRVADDTFRAPCVILAEGVNNLLTRSLGLQEAYVPAEHVALGIKEVIGLDRATLEDRFQLEGRRGFAAEYVGYAGVEGGGFLYTNRDSVSVGLVLGLAALRDRRQAPYDLLAGFKEHPALRDLLRGGTVVEYSAHVVSTGDLRGLPREVYAPGVLVAGEAAGLVLNAGRAIRGMDFAMHSGILAAETVVTARGDASAGALSAYRRALEASYVLTDLRRFQGAARLLHRPEMSGPLPALACDFGRAFFTPENRPGVPARRLLADAVRRHASWAEALRLGFQAFRSL